MDKSLIINKIKEEKKFKTDADLASYLGIAPNTLSNWRVRNTLDYDLIISKWEDINANWLITGKGSVYKDTPTKQKSVTGIPLIPIEAMAGWGEGETQVLNYETSQYIVPEFSGKADFLITVRGSSMYPKYSSGDIVACKKVSIGTFFQWNKVYVLDTSQGPLVKRIKKSDKEEHILCISDNKDYDPFELPINELYNIALVIGVIRFE